MGSSRQGWKAVGCMVTAMSAAAQVVGCSEQQLVATTLDSFDEFEKSLPRDPGTNGWVVEGDILIASRDALRAFWSQSGVPGALIVSKLTTGSDNVWPVATRRNLTYCIQGDGSSFPTSIAPFLDNAAATWAAVADVHFVHDTSQDATCSSSNNNVVFNVTNGIPCQNSNNCGNGLCLNHICRPDQAALFLTSSTGGRTGHLTTSHFQSSLLPSQTMQYWRQGTLMAITGSTCT